MTERQRLAAGSAKTETLSVCGDRMYVRTSVVPKVRERETTGRRESERKWKNEDLDGERRRGKHARMTRCVTKGVIDA